MITQAELKELLEYNPDTGVFTCIKKRQGIKKIGDIYTKIGSKGYICICINKKLYFAHRLAYLYMTGNFPAKGIDHINHIRDDNRWANLRAATQSQNMANVKKHKRNTSGYKGASFHKRRNKWRAEIRHNKKSIHIGYYNTPQEAHAAYISMAKKLHGEFMCIE